MILGGIVFVTFQALLIIFDNHGYLFLTKLCRLFCIEGTSRAHTFVKLLLSQFLLLKLPLSAFVFDLLTAFPEKLFELIDHANQNDDAIYTPAEVKDVYDTVANILVLFGFVAQTDE